MNQDNDNRQLKGGIKDDLEGGTTGATSMTDGDWRELNSGQSAGENEARLGGRPGGPAEADQGAIGLGTVGGSPSGEAGGDMPSGPGANGSLGSGTYNERGNLTGPDSPAGENFMFTPGEGQGDDLANQLGGGEGRGTGMTGGGAATGAHDADRSRPDPESALGSAGAGAPSGGDPGGMGGVHAGGGTGTGRPPGGVSPVQADTDRH
jgi:hypothetical protein